MDSIGEPLTNTEIYFYPKFEWKYESLSSRSDLEGRYRIKGFRAGLYRVSIRQNFSPGAAGAPAPGEFDIRIDASMERDLQIPATPPPGAALGKPIS